MNVFNRQDDDFEVIKSVWSDIPKRYRWLIALKCFWYRLGFS
jgi:hypothetical protein